jgi:ubiquinone/menaquinone biosynthesis C-methylase UbiE
MAEHVCPPWLSFTLTNIFRRIAQDPDRILGRFIRPGNIVLDIGCGPGYFTVPMARMAGETGSVVAVDIHPGMLERTRKRAERAGVSGRIRLHLADRDRLGLDVRADFALAFWMAHEVPEPGRLFADIRAALKPESRLLLVEPRMHVTEMAFADLVEAAAGAGFVREGEERIRLSRATVLRPDGQPAAR